MKYFGTDGIRGVIDKDLSPTLIKKVANGLIRYYKSHNLKRILLVGNDSRASSDYILSVLATKLLRHGFEIHNLHICSSPCLAYTAKKYNYPLGLMISASHNPSEYNGLKFFNNHGEKVSDEFEEELETLMDMTAICESKSYSCIKNVEILKTDYISYLKKMKRFNFPCILDCANGGTADICNQIFPRLEKINTRPNGYNINKNAGCTHIEILRNMCIKKHTLGFAFDGDGDRIHVVSETGDIITGDKILYILSKFFQRNGDSLVGTIYTNTGLERSLRQRDISLLRADVGDKKVSKLMRDTDSMLGGEDSGHIILAHHANTGDGVLIMIILCNILTLSKQSFAKLLQDYSEDYQGRRNIHIDNDLHLDEDTKMLIKTYENEGAKIIIRPSGTEPVWRLFVEHKDKNVAEKILDNLVQILTR
ncbi:MAG: hypothetical protein E7351_00855 [Clostridiales bacterium]|nr:hypothetical protein [Clostridiales bacterium]